MKPCRLVSEIPVAVGALAIALPVLLLFLTGFKPNAKIVRFQGILPRLWTLANFREVQFFPGIPRDLEDAASIDGCSRFGAYSRIVLPLSKPALATLAIFTFCGSWNDFLGPLVFLDSVDQYTLPVGIALFQASYYSEYGLTLAASMLCSPPVIAAFIMFQRHIIEGIALTGLKD